MVPQRDHPALLQVRPEVVDNQAGEGDDHVIMAIDKHQKGTVGCAYYVTREETLYCLQDLAQGAADNIEKLKFDIRPTILLSSSRVDQEERSVEPDRPARPESLVGDEGDEAPLSYQTHIRPTQEFSYEGAKSKLVSLETAFAQNAGPVFLVPGDPSAYEMDDALHHEMGCTGRQGKLLALSSSIDFENRVGIGCVGAILTYIQRRRASDFLPHDPGAQLAFRITALEMVSLNSMMFINPETLLSLQIIQPESHPNVFNQGPGTAGSKESLSIYGLFHHFARTPQGKVRLRQAFLRPLQRVNEIDLRLDFVTVFVRPENLITLQKISRGMSKIKNIRTVMNNLHRGINGGNQKPSGFKSGVWATLLEFAYHTIDIRDSLRETLGAESLPVVIRTMDVFDVNALQEVGTSIHNIVDLELSIEQNRTVINREINEQLDDIKNTYEGMDDLLSSAAADIAQTLPQHIAAKLNVIYFPQLGYHITIPLDPATRRPMYHGDPDDDEGGGTWERMFTTENQVFFKDARMRAMDERLGDLWTAICDLEIEISYELAQRILQYEGMLIAVSDLCGELDCLLALAQGANQYNLVRPQMTEENIIDIKGCRHLLQEMTVPSYVANDAYLVGGSNTDPDQEPTPPQPTLSPSHPNMLLLTGPNYSGKSVYLKSVSQTIYLSHIGSFVPCSPSPFPQPVIGLTDAILTRIRTSETCSRPQSAFVIDLQQIARCLRVATARSLIVIDEFGKGTESCDGAGLACGIFTHLLERGRVGEAPKVLAATHFHEIFEQGWLKERGDLGLRFVHMDVRVDRAPGRRRGGGGGRGESEDDGDQIDAYDGGRAIGTGTGMDTETEVTYLYTLHPGLSTQSFGIQCAAMNGVPAPVVARADQLSRLALRGEDLVSVCAVLDRGEEELERAEEEARRFMEWDLGGQGVVRFDGGKGRERDRERDVKMLLRELLGDEDEDEGEDEGKGDLQTTTGTESRSVGGEDADADADAGEPRGVDDSV